VHSVGSAYNSVAVNRQSSGSNGHDAVIAADPESSQDIPCAQFNNLEERADEARHNIADRGESELDLSKELLRDTSMNHDSEDFEFDEELLSKDDERVVDTNTDFLIEAEDYTSIFQEDIEMNDAIQPNNGRGVDNVKSPSLSESKLDNQNNGLLNTSRLDDNANNSPSTTLDTSKHNFQENVLCLLLKILKLSFILTCKIHHSF
jgi:hypothetical protein